MKTELIEKLNNAIEAMQYVVDELNAEEREASGNGNGSTRQYHRLCAEDKKQIIQRVLGGETTTAIASDIGCSAATVSYVRCKHLPKEYKWARF